MLLLKRDYNLTNLYMGIFGPVTMLHSEMLDPLLRLIKHVGPYPVPSKY